MTENGPIPDMEHCLKAGVKWGMFMSWSDLVFSQNSKEHIKEVYDSSSVKSLSLSVPKFNRLVHLLK